MEENKPDTVAPSAEGWQDAGTGALILEFVVSPGWVLTQSILQSWAVPSNAGDYGDQRRSKVG